jgi:hypothetical protein
LEEATHEEDDNDKKKKKSPGGGVGVQRGSCEGGADGAKATSASKSLKQEALMFISFEVEKQASQSRF